MELREYLDAVTQQIRCRQARPMVEEEIRRHIEDQAEAFCCEGMNRQEAQEAAIREMGDPVEAGALLDRVHRPRMEWSVLVLVGIMSAVGLLLQYLFVYRCGLEGSGDYFVKQLGYTAFGFCCMLLVYRLDYTLLARWAVPIGVILLLVLFLMSYGPLEHMLPYAHKRLWIYALSLLCIPVYAGILFYFRDAGYLNLFFCLAILVFSVWVVMGAGSGAALLQIYLIPLVMLCAAVGRGWFRVKRGRAMTAILGIAVVLPAAGMGMRLLLDVGVSYRLTRVKILLGMSMGDPTIREHMVYEQWLGSLIKEFKMIGQAEFPKGNMLIHMQNDYVVTGLFAYYGILAGVLLLLLVGFFLLRMFRVAGKQKNQLGFMVGLSCAMIFAFQSVIYIFSNLRGGFVAQMNMPFLSYGFTCTMTNFILMGIFLSVHRGEMITEEKKIRRSWHIRLVHEK